MSIEHVLREMLNRRGESPTSVSLGIGRSPKYVSRMISGRVKLGAETLALLGDFLGYDLVLVDRKDKSGAGNIAISPPEH